MEESASLGLAGALTAIKSKVDAVFKDVGNQKQDVSLSAQAATDSEREKEVLMRLEKALDDLSKLHHAPKVCVLYLIVC